MVEKKFYMVDSLDVAELGDGPPLILVHSLLADLSVFERVETELACLRNADPAMFASAARALADLSLHDSLHKVSNSVLVLVGAVDQPTPPRTLPGTLAGDQRCAI